MTTIAIDTPTTGLHEICAPILRALPQWFGIEEATQHYIDSIRTLPTLLARLDDSPAGFLTIKQHSDSAAEIYVMGVYPHFHRHGVGRALLKQTEMELQAQGIRFLQVKTLSSKHPDPYYARTREFYEAMHFVPLEEFDDLWGEANPCLMLIKYVEAHT